MELLKIIQSQWSYIIIGLLTIGLIILVILITRSQIYRISRLYKIILELADKIEKQNFEQRPFANAIEMKRQQFLNIPNITFHYSDKDRITSFYNDYFSEPTIETMVSELVTEASGDLKAELPKLLEAKIGSKDVSKWISTMKLPETSLNGMFLRYQRETIKKGQVTIGLELVDIELSELQEFHNLIHQLNDRFGLPIATELVRQREVAIKEKAAESTLIKLEQARGSVLIEGKFLISEKSADFYECIYMHPVSDYFHESHKSVTISFLLMKSMIEKSVAGNYEQSLGQKIPLRVYGDVWQPINRDDQVWNILLTPLAVY